MYKVMDISKEQIDTCYQNQDFRNRSEYFEYSFYDLHEADPFFRFRRSFLYVSLYLRKKGFTRKRGNYSARFSTVSRGLARSRLWPPALWRAARWRRKRFAPIRLPVHLRLWEGFPSGRRDSEMLLMSISSARLKSFQTCGLKPLPGEAFPKPKMNDDSLIVAKLTSDPVSPRQD